jgi:selenocysteine lyase/cysteine desulfurase
VLALTWVHSSTGLKLPLRRIAETLDRINADRDEADRVLFCVDGVHGFGIEDVVLADLGCDFLMAGCHKWLFGPRGTGIVAGTKRGWDAVLPPIPSFIDGGTWEAWFTGSEPAGPNTAGRIRPAGISLRAPVGADASLPLPPEYRKGADCGAHTMSWLVS